MLILGWTRKVPTLLREFAADDMEIDVVGLTPVEDRMAVLADHRDLALDHVRQMEKNFLDPVKLAELEPSGYDQIPSWHGPVWAMWPMPMQPPSPPI